jgi:hypothetical protein
MSVLVNKFCELSWNFFKYFLRQVPILNCLVVSDKLNDVSLRFVSLRISQWCAIGIKEYHFCEVRKTNADDDDRTLQMGKFNDNPSCFIHVVNLTICH